MHWIQAFTHALHFVWGSCAPVGAQAQAVLALQLVLRWNLQSSGFYPERRFRYIRIYSANRLCMVKLYEPPIEGMCINDNQSERQFLPTSIISTAA